MKRITILFCSLFLISFSSLFSQNFGTFASAVWLTDCTTSNFFNTTGEGPSLIGPPENVFTNTNFGVFIQNSGTFILRGGEVKTFKNSSGNACSVRMNYRIYLESETPGAFSIVDFPFFEDCNVGSSEFPSGGPCGEGDQKWQRVIADGETTPFAPIDLTTFAPGNYVLEVFFEATGDLNSSTECDDIVFVNDGGNNYKAFFSVRTNPTFISSNPSTCSGADGSITLSNLNPDSTYTFSYSDGGSTIGPNSITADNNGEFILSNLTAGNYSNFNFTINNCFTTVNNSVVLNDPTVNPPTSGGNQTVCEASPIQTLTANATTSDGSIIVWYDAEVDGNIVTNPTLGTVGSITYYAEGQNETSNCISLTRTAVTLTINPAPAAPTGETTQTICSPLTVVFTLNFLVVNGTNLQWYADADGTIPLTSDTPLVNNTTYYVTQTVNGCESNETLAVLFLQNNQLLPTVTVVQPTCPDPIGSITVTSPVSSGNLYSDLIISEVTDESIGSLTYIELFNGTGSTIDLSNYRIKVYNNGNTNPSCNLLLSGLINTNSVRIISIGSNGNQGGVVPDLVFAGCGGVNIDDNIRLTNSADAEIDVWGRIDGEAFTPNNEPGYTYRRLATASAPSSTWNAADWEVIDPQDYTNVGEFINVSSSSYEYSIDNGISFQTNPFFEDLEPGNYTVVVRDIITGCFSQSLEVALNQPNNEAVPVFNFGETIAICFNQPVPSLPTSDNNGITGNWAPSSIDSTQSGSYTFTPDENQCATTFILTVTVNNFPTPVFDFGNNLTICSGDEVPVLPAEDNNGVNGFWEPATIDNEVGNTYTFIVNNSECASNFILTVIVNELVTPVFNFGNAITICSGETVPNLPTTDNNGVNGIWTPASIDNTQTANYTFEPTDACVESFTLTVTVSPQVTPIFSFGNQLTICSGENVPSLPASDNNGVNGVWTPASIDNTETANYTFEPTDACAESFTLTVTISPQVTPVFSFGNQLTFCSGETAPSLPTLDNNGVNGVWTPASIDNTQTANYTFEPADDCAENFILNVTVNEPITPIFSLPSSICFNSNAEIILPTESENGIIGTWNPSTINSTNDTLYTFTPASTSCATGFSTTIAVLPTFSIEIFDQCENNQFTIGVELNDNSNVILTDYSWINENGTVVGTNSSTFNITEYIRSTPQTETFPLFFTVRATSIDGCFAEESISIPTIFCGIQKGISPNGDNLNDFFDLALLDVEKLSIFNRYGRKVYTQNNYTNQWFGQTDDGKELPSATYYYVIEFRNGESKSGWIYIMREESR